MCPMDFGVKSTKVKVTMQGLLKKVSGTKLLPLSGTKLGEFELVAAGGILSG